jgi:GNAT superfamily N-acetyltransferase
MSSGAPQTLLEPGASRPAGGQSKTELVRLRDGSFVTVREVLPGDETRIRGFLTGLSLENRRLRFFGPAIDLQEAAHAAVKSAPGRCGLVAHDEIGVLVGHALYGQLDATHAEVAVEVADHLHGDGLGTILIERLAAIAEKRGITHFVAEVLCENRAMLDVFREGFDARVIRRDGPEEQVEFLTSGWRLAEARFSSTENEEGEGHVQEGDRRV